MAEDPEAWNKLQAIVAEQERAGVPSDPSKSPAVVVPAPAAAAAAAAAPAAAASAAAGSRQLAASTGSATAGGKSAQPAPAAADVVAPASAASTASASSAASTAAPYPVTIQRVDGKWGLSVVGDQHGVVPGVYVKDVRNAPAVKAGLVEGCRLLQVGDTDVTRATQAEVVTLLVRAGASLKLVVVKDPAGLARMEALDAGLPATAAAAAAAANAERTIKLRRSGQGFGFRLAGAVEVPGPLYVSLVVPGGPADIPEGLRVGDRILKVGSLDTSTTLQGGLEGESENVLFTFQ